MYCEHCGFRIERGEECEQCADLDFRYVDDSEKPIDIDAIRWAEDGGYVLKTTRLWSRSEYIAIQDPEDVDSIFEKRSGEKPTGFFSIVDLFRRR
jgi:hypothetical protein